MPFRVKSIYTQEVFTQFHSVVSNSRETKLSWDEDRIRDFYGCPFLIGIDVYALDYIPKDKSRQDLQRLVCPFYKSQMEYFKFLGKM